MLIKPCTKCNRLPPSYMNVCRWCLNEADPIPTWFLLTIVGVIFIVGFLLGASVALK